MTGLSAALAMAHHDITQVYKKLLNIAEVFIVTQVSNQKCRSGV
jgi:hypothetical protein